MGGIDHPNQPAQSLVLPPGWMHTLKAIVLQKTSRSSARLKGLGVVVSLAIAAAAIFALTHALKNVDYDEVFAVVRRTSPGVIAAGADAGGGLLRQSDPLRPAGAAHDQACRHSLPDRSAREFHQLSRSRTASARWR